MRKKPVIRIFLPAGLFLMFISGLLLPCFSQTTVSLTVLLKDCTDRANAGVFGRHGSMRRPLLALMTASVRVAAPSFVRALSM